MRPAVALGPIRVANKGFRVIDPKLREKSGQKESQGLYSLVTEQKKRLTINGTKNITFGAEQEQIRPERNEAEALVLALRKVLHNLNQGCNLSSPIREKSKIRNGAKAIIAFRARTEVKSDVKWSQDYNLWSQNWREVSPYIEPRV